VLRHRHTPHSPLPPPSSILHSVQASNMLKGGFSIPSEEGDDPALLAALRLSLNDSQGGVSEAIACQVCFIDLNSLSLENRHAHYEQHFAGPTTCDISPFIHSPKLTFTVADNVDSSPPKPANLTSFSSTQSKSRRTATEKENLFWHARLSTPPPSNFTPGDQDLVPKEVITDCSIFIAGLIPVLRRCLARSHGKGHTLKAALCHEQAVHVATQLWDLGWGCGYVVIHSVDIILIPHHVKLPQLSHGLHSVDSSERTTTLLCLARRRARSRRTSSSGLD
jgi:hypothetical protein